jgi:hypothetical protein
MHDVFYRWFIFDDQGTELSSEGGSWGGNADLPYGRDFKGTAQFQKVKNIPQYLTVIPCRYIVGGEEVVSGDPVVRVDPDSGCTITQKTITTKAKDPGESTRIINGNYPIELSQGKMGKLIIKDIKIENGLLGNFLLLLPLGFFLPMFWVKLRSFKRTLAIGALISVSIEIAQYLLVYLGLSVGRASDNDIYETGG